MVKIAAFAIAALMPLSGFAQQTVVLRDGTRYSGTMVRADENSVTFRDESGRNRNFNTDQVQSIEFDRNGRSNNERAFGDRRTNNDRNDNYRNDNSRNDNYRNDNSRYDNRNNGAAYGNNSNASNYGNDRGSGRGYMTIPAGTEISVRTNQTIDTRNANSGNYSAQIDRDVMGSDGNVLIPRGSDAQLVVRDSGSREVALDLQSISVNGRRYDVDSGEVTQQTQGREGVGANKRTGEYAGGGAVLGTLLGAIAGGGKGAAIGALAGAAAGVGTQVLTRGSQVKVPAETVLNFRLDNPLRLR